MSLLQQHDVSKDIWNAEHPQKQQSQTRNASSYVPTGRGCGPAHLKRLMVRSYHAGIAEGGAGLPRIGCRCGFQLEMMVS